MSGAGKVVYVYDAATEELMEELGGASDVKCVAVFEREGEGLIVARYEDGTIKVWDAGARFLNCHPAQN